jgi:hypothetical protein
MADMTGMYQWFANAYNQGLNNTTNTMGQANQQMVAAQGGLISRALQERDRFEAMAEREKQRAAQERAYRDSRSDQEMQQQFRLEQLKMQQAADKRDAERAAMTMQEMEQGLKFKAERQDWDRSARPLNEAFRQAQTDEMLARAEKSKAWREDQEEDRKLRERQIGIQELTGKASAASAYAAAAEHKKRTEMMDRPAPQVPMPAWTQAEMDVAAKDPGQRVQDVAIRTGTLKIIGVLPDGGKVAFNNNNGSYMVYKPSEDRWIDVPPGDPLLGRTSTQPPPTSPAPSLVKLLRPSVTFGRSMR